MRIEVIYPVMVSEVHRHAATNQLDVVLDNVAFVISRWLLNRFKSLDKKNILKDLANVVDLYRRKMKVFHEVFGFFVSCCDVVDCRVS